MKHSKDHLVCQFTHNLQITQTIKFKLDKKTGMPKAITATQCFSSLIDSLESEFSVRFSTSIILINKNKRITVHFEVCKQNLSRIKSVYRQMLTAAFGRTNSAHVWKRTKGLGILYGAAFNRNNHKYKNEFQLHGSILNYTQAISRTIFRVNNSKLVLPMQYMISPLSLLNTVQFFLLQISEFTIGFVRKLWTRVKKNYLRDFARLASDSFLWLFCFSTRLSLSEQIRTRSQLHTLTIWIPLKSWDRNDQFWLKHHQNRTSGQPRAPCVMAKYRFCLQFKA